MAYAKSKKQTGEPKVDAYAVLSAAVAAGKVGNVYVLHGEERYLLDRALAMLRRHLCPDGLGGFNYKRFDGKTLTVEELSDAVNALPVFAERTLVEVHDFDIFHPEHMQDTLKLLSDPELNPAVCVVFVYTTLAFDPTGRKKKPDADGDGGDGDADAGATDAAETADGGMGAATTSGAVTAADAETGAAGTGGGAGGAKRPKKGKPLPRSTITKIAQILDFAAQDKAKLAKWIKKHYADLGKQVSPADAEYLSYITGGYMATLHGEIEKTAAYADGETVTRADIDAVVIPELDAVAYKLTDALARRDFPTATRILDELFRMREPPHKIMFSISLNVRKLLAARICIENRLDAAELIDICSLRFDWQARPLLDAARKMSLAACRDAVAACAETAFELNNSDPEAAIVELVARLALG
jgi:DNA polymerase III delta subunit